MRGVSHVIWPLAIFLVTRSLRVSQARQQVPSESKQSERRAEPAPGSCVPDRAVPPAVKSQVRRRYWGGVVGDPLVLSHCPAERDKVAFALGKLRTKLGGLWIVAQRSVFGVRVNSCGMLTLFCQWGTEWVRVSWVKIFPTLVWFFFNP